MGSINTETETVIKKILPYMKRRGIISSKILILRRLYQQLIDIQKDMLIYW